MIEFEFLEIQIFEIEQKYSVIGKGKEEEIDFWIERISIFKNDLIPIVLFTIGMAMVLRNGPPVIVAQPSASKAHRVTGPAFY